MFSDAINSISWRCRPSSPLMAAAISGSACSSLAVKNESGAEPVLALEDGELIGEYLHRRSQLANCGRSRVAVGSVRSPIPYRAGMAKRLRYTADIYARYGGRGGGFRPPWPRTRRRGPRAPPLPPPAPAPP